MSNKKQEKINIPKEYIDTLKKAKELYSNIFSFEIGLRLAIDKHLTEWIGKEWWNIRLSKDMPDIFKYAEEHKKQSSIINENEIDKSIHNIHFITIGHLSEIVKKYKETFIPEVFPNLHFFLGHIEYIIKIRNCCCHMHPNIDKEYIKTLKAETLILSKIINSKII
ncbi:hypothetical protein EPJ70_05045 [Brachyspira aalborgi]|uniref:Swt1-like HEPN domain-containing protein n=1 Tax=Brachyspira aalborgi TaxID=29522 RepID=A0A5C8FAZ2_9SPIR|nr:hypothetical protein [Brachyspira aalborgi]TXJ45750.1 hypothetical protein EPJ70_05045 [Brachyspira aalborgi]